MLNIVSASVEQTIDVHELQDNALCNHDQCALLIYVCIFDGFINKFFFALGCLEKRG